MNPSVKSQFAGAIRDFFERMCEPATYKPAIGPAVEDCHVLISKAVDPQPDGFEAAAWQRTTTLECLAEEVGREPNRGDRFVVDSGVYVVKKLLDESDDLEMTYKMIVKKTVP